MFSCSQASCICFLCTLMTEFKKRLTPVFHSFTFMLIEPQTAKCVWLHRSEGQLSIINKTGILTQVAQEMGDMIRPLENSRWNKSQYLSSVTLSHDVYTGPIQMSTSVLATCVHTDLTPTVYTSSHRYGRAALLHTKAHPVFEDLETL